MNDDEKIPVSIDENIFEINKKLELVIDDSKKYPAVIKSRASKLLDLHTYEGQNSLNINKGDILKYFLSMNDQLGIDFYSCYSQVNKLSDYENGLRIGITYPKKIEKLGIRRFYRMGIVMPVLYSFINILDNYETIEDVPYGYFLRMHEALTSDISGNGLKITTEEFCKKSQQIVVEIPELNNLRLLGTVEWIEPDKINQNIKIAFSFKNIKHTVQDRIVNFIFNKMRESRTRY